MHAPIGDLTVFEEDGAIVALEWGWVADQRETPLLSRARQVLHSYFDSGMISGLPLNPRGTAHQHRVWKAMQAIPAGQTRSYGALAHDLDSGPRAVAGACARNPIPIFIPCHRVVGASDLGGYSGGEGLTTKHALLRLEGSLPA